MYLQRLSECLAIVFHHCAEPNVNCQVQNRLCRILTKTPSNFGLGGDFLGGEGAMNFSSSNVKLAASINLIGFLKSAVRAWL